jgi:hypothetical protein
VLNPTLALGKEFVPEEIVGLLRDGSPVTTATHVVQRETRVMLGQPREHPTRMVEALTRFAEKHPELRAGYLALMHDPSRDEKPHLVVGLAIDGAPEAIVREAGSIAADTAPNREPVDLVLITPGQPGLSAYFLDAVPPFYKRAQPR